YHVDPDVLESRYLVVDLYAPQVLENLEYTRIDPERGDQVRQDDVYIINRLIALGDFFLCASERQRDFWLGALAFAGRLDPAQLAADPELRSLIDIVPFGMPELDPVRTGDGPRAAFPAIQPNDPILLWNGGLWNWLDPKTAIRAVALLAARGLPVRLIFMGTKSPVANVAQMVVVDDARALAAELGVLDRHVFFNDWVDYGERQNWLLEATASLSLHVLNVEARYAFRTRLLDNLWCSLPAIATEGDVLADLIRAEGIGIVVPPSDPVVIADAIEQMLDPETHRAMAERIKSVRTRFTWERVSDPLLRYCRDPRRLGSTRGFDPTQSYIHHLERTYEQTAAYTQRLERVIAEKDEQLSTQFRVRAFARDAWSAARSTIKNTSRR
ncbi:MAG TPA: glycosyltransferase family 4 protein, partial [Thermomicrobiaceae bacterium]|nr:glycosyltransferase family 4 protein [Thermomicrobiaceae bacterium]